MTSMISFQGDWTVFFTRPISGVIMGLALLSLVYPLYRAIRARQTASHPQSRPTSAQQATSRP
jgi:putative tricarboxylic transport membrane protein